MDQSSRVMQWTVWPPKLAGHPRRALTSTSPAILSLVLQQEGARGVGLGLAGKLEAAPRGS